MSNFVSQNPYYSDDHSVLAIGVIVANFFDFVKES